MDIQYLNEFEELQDQNSFKGQQWFGDRQRLVEKYSWAVPNEDVIRYCAEFSDLIEIGAGNGYWAQLIRDAQRSDDIIRAVDIDPPEETYTTVEQVDMMNHLDAIKDGAVLLVWPPYDHGLATEVVRARPNHLLYVGEPRGGCTAEGGFFNYIDQEYGLVGKIDIPSYVGINDNFFHYARKR